MISFRFIVCAVLFWASGLVMGLMLDVRTRLIIKMALADMASDLLLFVRRKLYGR